MSLELFERVISEVAPVTEQVCLHLMGEPLGHPRLAEFVEVCTRHRVPIFFVTNGTLLRPDKAELLLHPSFRQVNFSLHSFFDNFPEGDPSTYLERIFAYTERALAERPDLYINFRLWNLEAPRGVGERNCEMLRQIEQRFSVEVADAGGLRKSRKLKGRLYLHFDTEFTWPALDLDFRGVHGTCKGLSTHFGVLACGTVVPCCLDKEGVIALGDLKTQPLHQILESPRALAMLRGFQQGQLNEALCQRCPYIERFARN